MGLRAAKKIVAAFLGPQLPPDGVPRLGLRFSLGLGDQAGHRIEIIWGQQAGCLPVAGVKTAMAGVCVDGR
jgi:hypothetical protein